MSAETARQAHQRRRQCQSSRGIAREASLLPAKIVGLKSILLDALGIDEPESSLEVVVALDPTDIGRDTPVRIFPGCCATSTEVSVGACRPIIAEVDEHSPVLVKVLKTKILHRLGAK